MVLPRWQINLSAHGISMRSSQQRIAKSYSAGSYWVEPLENWFSLKVQADMQSWGNQLLCKVTAFSSTRFPKSEISTPGSDWESQPLVHITAQIPLKTQSNWVFLGCCQEICPGSLWLYIQHSQGKYAKSIGISWYINHLKMGTLDVLLDGCI